MQQKKKVQVAQVMYQGRWVDKDTFRAFVYNKDSQKLANSWADYNALVESGLWFSEKPKADENNLVEKPKRKKAEVKENPPELVEKLDATSPNG